MTLHGNRSLARHENGSNPAHSSGPLCDPDMQYRLAALFKSSVLVIIAYHRSQGRSFDELVLGEYGLNRSELVVLE